MNVHESEILAGILESMGYISTNDDLIADVIVFNTCCIRDNAEQKVIGNIGAYKKIKKARPTLILCIVGCMTQQQASSDNIYKHYPFVDIILGNHNKYDIRQAIEHKLLAKKRIMEIPEEDFQLINDDAYLMNRTSGTNAWVNIMYGCNNFCSYCIVPYVRGRERSRSREEIIKEVKQCINDGYKEITLLGQNVNSYGLDIGNNYTFADLLEELASIDGKFRINYMTSHPKDFNNRIINIIKNYDNVSKYIHLPIQSGSNKILKLMNRKYTREKYIEIIDNIRRELPDVGITTDIMVGFPEETEEDFQDTLDIVRYVNYSNAFMFIYSPRIGTPAADMTQIDEDIKNNRIRRLIDLQRSLTTKQSHSLINSILEVLAEDNSPKIEGMLCGRSSTGRLVHFVPNNYKIGDFLKVKITANKASALIGEAVGDYNG